MTPPPNKKRSKQTKAKKPGKGWAFKPISVDWPTEFGRLLAERLNTLAVSRIELTRELAELADREWYPGLAGPLTMIFQGKKPPTVLGAEGAWLKALRIEPASPEAPRFMDAFRAHVVYTKTGGAGGAGDILTRQAESMRARLVEEENRRLRARLAALERGGKEPPVIGG